MIKKQPNEAKEEAIKAREFDEIAKTIFSPIYPILAGIILEKSPVKTGTCLDLGSGPGHLAMAVSNLNPFTTIALDFSLHAQRLALKNIRDAGLEGRVIPVQGDVHRLPFPDNSIDLAISRGSIFFWDSPEQVFREVYRVLKPGSCSFIGGGFGTPELKREIIEKMQQRSGDFREATGKRMSPENIERLSRALSASPAKTHRVERDEANLWFIMEKDHV